MTDNDDATELAETFLEELGIDPKDLPNMVRLADAHTIKWCSQHDYPIKWGEHCWLGGMKPAPGARNFPDPEPCVVETPPRHFKAGGSR